MLGETKGLPGVDSGGSGLVGCAVGRVKEARSPLHTVKSATVFRFSPCMGTEARKTARWGPATARTPPLMRVTQDGPSIVEAQGEFHAQVQFSPKALDDADDMRVSLANRHEVDQTERPITMGECGFENQRMSAIPARGFPFALRRSDLPVAVFFCADESSEAGLGGKIGPAKPVDGAVFVDESCGFAVADQGVVFDFRGHGCRKFRGSPYQGVWASCYA